MYLYFLAVNIKPRNDSTLESEEDKQISFMRYSEPGGHQETDISRVRCHQIYGGSIFNRRASCEMYLVLDYGFMKIRSEEDHRQDTLWLVKTTAKSRKNSTFYSETPRENGLVHW